MRQASVGFHCPECVNSGTQRVYTARSLVKVPYAVYTIIALNVAVFVYGVARDSENGLSNVSGPLLQSWSLFGPFIDLRNEWYRIATSGFVHAGFIHLGLNMYLLYVLGKQLEVRFGPVDFSLVYAAGLVGGSLGALILDPTVPSVGASGAVYGLMGLYVFLSHRQRISIWASGIGGLLLINFLFTFAVSGVSVGGHVGGFLGGIAGGSLLVYGPDRIKDKRLVSATIVVLIGALFGGAVVAAIAGTPA